MDDQQGMAELFERHRGRLRAVAYRMLGSLAEADDAVQETWLRLTRADTDALRNPRAWLTTVVARVSLNMLRARAARREEPFQQGIPEPLIDPAEGTSPEHETLLADALGLALLIVVQTLSPSERLAYVLHDMFDVPFDEIAPILQRSAPATRQLASRARRRVRHGSPPTDADPIAARAAVDAFLAAARHGDLAALVAVLHPEVIHRVDRGAAGGVSQVRGAHTVAGRAAGFSQQGLHIVPVLINGLPGAVSSRERRAVSVLAFTVAGCKITEIDALTDPDRLQLLRLDTLGSG